MAEVAPIVVAHVSDSHHRHDLVSNVAPVDCDLILLTGDNIANHGRVTAYSAMTWGGKAEIARIRRDAEMEYQEEWLREVTPFWVRAFRGRPVIYVPGNHDFYPLETALRAAGHDQVWTVVDGAHVDLLGRRWAGFREIPYIDGEWVGETRDFGGLIDRAFACDPDVLVTHAPPYGILDCDYGTEHYGISALTSALQYREHKIRHHFFGHVHSPGGRATVVNGVTYINGACCLKVHSI